MVNDDKIDHKFTLLHYIVINLDKPLKSIIKVIHQELLRIQS